MAQDRKPTGPVKRRRRMPSAGELRLWRQVTQDIAPFKPQPIEEASAEQTAEQVQPKKLTRTKQRIVRQANPVKPQPPRLPELAVGDTAGFDKRNALRLKRGKHPIEDRIDLHGNTQDTAHRALTRFITRSHDDGLRCVLVVTGKGSRDGSIGVLRSAVPQWLNQSPNRERIIAVTHATQGDGGQGALYVMLKRKR